ncbi:DNA-binding NarL/FixJ family response regulator [Janibacter sp. UYMM211]
MSSRTDHHPIRVVLVDDQALVRAGFRMVLDAQPDMVVVGEAEDGQHALEVLGAVSADVVLMDIRMPRMDGVAATEELLRRDPDGPKVVVLTTFDLDEYAYAALRAGASGFLLKEAGPPTCSPRSMRCTAATRSSRRARPAGSSSTSPATGPGRSRTRPRSRTSPPGLTTRVWRPSPRARSR